MVTQSPQIPEVPSFLRAGEGGGPPRQQRYVQHVEILRGKGRGSATEERGAAILEGQALTALSDGLGLEPLQRCATSKDSADGVQGKGSSSKTSPLRIWAALIDMTLLIAIAAIMMAIVLSLSPSINSADLLLLLKKRHVLLPFLGLIDSLGIIYYTIGWRRGASLGWFICGKSKDLNR